MKNYLERGFVLWFTGLPSAGKTTLAGQVREALDQRQVPTELFDGDVVRTYLSTRLGFSKEDRDVNVKRIGFVCNLVARHGVAALAAAISPYEATRQEVRAACEVPFVEVFVNCPVEVCAERDVKGMYAKAKRGEIKHFTGVDDPYEAPAHAEIVCRTHLDSLEQSVAQVMGALEEMKLIPAASEKVA